MEEAYAREDHVIKFMTLNTMNFWSRVVFYE